LRIIVGQGCQPLLQPGGWRHHNSGIDFADGPFRRICILLLDNAYNIPVFTHNAAIAGRIVEFHRQDRQLILVCNVQQSLQRTGGG
jgi:hypothetical protein